MLGILKFFFFQYEFGNIVGAPLDYQLNASSVFPPQMELSHV